MDALVVADLTTGPQGQLLTYAARIAEILRRYPQDSAVHRAVSIASDELAVHVERVQRRLLATCLDVGDPTPPSISKFPPARSGRGEVGCWPRR